MTEFANGEVGYPAALRRRWIDRWRIYHPEEEYKMNSIADLLRVEDIVLNLKVASKDKLIEAIGLHMEKVHGMPHEWVALSLSRREQIGSTGLGEGFAIPHARVKDLQQIHVAYVRLSSPIAFDAPDDKPVTDVFVLLVPKQATEAHLTILAEATQIFSDRRLREGLRLCNNAPEVAQLFQRWPLAT